MTRLTCVLMREVQASNTAQRQVCSVQDTWVLERWPVRGRFARDCHDGTDSRNQVFLIALQHTAVGPGRAVAGKNCLEKIEESPQKWPPSSAIPAPSSITERKFSSSSQRLPHSARCAARYSTRVIVETRGRCLAESQRKKRMETTSATASSGLHCAVQWSCHWSTGFDSTV